MIRVLAALAVVVVIAGGCASQPAAPRAATPAPAPVAPAPFTDRELADELVRQGVGAPKDAPTTPPGPGEDVPTEIRQTPRGVVVTFRYVLFAFDSTGLTPQARREIERMAFVLNHPQAAARRITLEGHTDAIGTEAYNRELSRRRAEVVAQELVARGLQRDRVNAEGFGKQRPVAPNTLTDGKDNPAGRALNRRVEAVVQLTGGRAAMMTSDFAADWPKEPFHPSADPDVFFETRAGKAVFQRLIAALEEGAPRLAVLTGPPGTGKTTLLRRVSAELARRGWKTVIEGLPLGLDDLRDRLAASEPGRRVVVGLDEAQALSSDLLVALDSLLIVRPDLRILLVGQPLLEAKLDALRLGGAAIRESVRCRLGPLDADDVRGYLDFRWRAVRGGAHPFAPEAVERIAAVSEGIPQMINLMCGLALRLAEVRGIDRVTAEVVDEATGELPRPEPRHRVSHGGRSSAAPASRKMRAAMVAAVMIPPLLVAGGLLLRRAAHVPSPRDQPPPAARAPLTPAGPVWVAALAPEPTSIDGPTAAGLEPVRESPPPIATAPAKPPPDARATRAGEPPASPERSRGGKEHRESTALKVAAATPMLPPMPRRAVSIPSAAPVVKTAAPVAKSDPGKDEALLRRAEYGDLKGIQTLLLGGASPEARDPAGFTPLMLAVIHGHPAIVNALVAGGGRVNVQNRTGLTPLMLAAINNHSGMLRALIDHGADVNARTLAGWTALTYGAWRGHAHIVRVLLARGADPNVTDREGWTIFQYASWRASEPVANDDLPELSADAGRPTGLGPGHAEVVALLRQAGVKR